MRVYLFDVIQFGLFFGKTYIEQMFFEVTGELEVEL
jgi:hypothetical protein